MFYSKNREYLRNQSSVKTDSFGITITLAVYQRYSAAEAALKTVNTQSEPL